MKNREDLGNFLAEKLPSKFEDKEPKWKIWIQKNYEGDKAFAVWKAHHFFADGVSSVCCGMQLDEHYDHTKLLDFKQPSFLQKWLFRLCVPFVIPIIMIKESFR